MPYPELSQMQRLSGFPTQFMMPEAARQFDALAAAFRRERGNVLVPNEAWRSYNTAVNYFVTRYRRVNYWTGLRWDGSYWVKKPGVAPAGIPGTSKHMFGLAVDVDIYSFSSNDYDALERLAPRYGYSLQQGIWDGEPWHIVYVGSPTEVAGDVGTVIDNSVSEEKRDQDMYINGVGGTDYFFTPLGDVPITSVEDHALLTRFLKGNDKFNQAQKNDINSYIFRAGQQFRDALAKSVSVPEVPTVDEIWASGVSRGGKMISVKQEVAHAKTYAMQAVAAVAALDAALQAAKTGIIDVSVIQKAARAGAAEALSGLEATVTVDLNGSEG